MFLSNRNKLSRNYNHIITDKYTLYMEEDSATLAPELTTQCCSGCRLLRFSSSSLQPAKPTPTQTSKPAVLEWSRARPSLGLDSTSPPGNCSGEVHADNKGPVPQAQLFTS